MKIKKYLPIILFLLGIAILVGAILLVVKGKKTSSVDDEETALLKDFPLVQRPVAKLIPSEDGHWLKLQVEKFEIDAESLDYELLYKLPDGRTQGVPGTVELKGQDSIDRDLLLGSESSGKYRYDEGVESGTLTLRFRNSSGKLVARFTTDFMLYSDSKTLASKDGDFSMKLSSTPDMFFVVMGTFGIPEEPAGQVASGPYGVFSSDDSTLKGSVEIASGELNYWTGSAWSTSIKETDLPTGIFLGVSE